MMRPVSSQSTPSVEPMKCVARTNKDFVNGVCSGYLEYYFLYQDKELTDLDVYAFLVQNLTDAQGTDLFNAGYCTGWIEALLEDRQVLQ